MPAKLPGTGSSAPFGTRLRFIPRTYWCDCDIGAHAGQAQVELEGYLPAADYDILLHAVSQSHGGQSAPRPGSPTSGS